MLQLLTNQVVCKPQKIHKQKPITVFVVDDDKDDRLLVFSNLLKSSCISQVHPIPSAKSLFCCLKKMGIYDSDCDESHKFLILLDINMPDTDGIKTLDYIRNHPMTAGIPVVLMSSEISGNQMYEAYGLEVNGFLQKPFKLESFNKIIESNYSWAIA
jgi:CheY-like chemotaxis protein